MNLSVVIPVYGCCEAISELYKRLTNTLKSQFKEYEIILVNDACPQNSWCEIERICKHDSRVVGIELSRNFGQMKAIAAGLDYSSGDWVVVMDCDLQDAPEEIPRLYQKAQEGYDVVFARRQEREDGLVKKLLSAAFYKVYSYATDGNYDASLCNFSICKRQVIDEYCKMKESHRAYVMYINWLGFKHGVIDVKHQPRFSGKSSYSLSKRISLAADILTSQSDKLLRLIAKVGLLISLISFIMIIVTIVRYYALHIPQGYTSMFATLFFLGGLILSALGIVGIYIGNIFMEVKHRPLYIVRTVLNNDSTESIEGRGEDNR